jgi:hypothetical protein
MRRLATPRRTRSSSVSRATAASRVNAATLDVSPCVSQGTDAAMDAFTHDYRLTSDEGPPFGHQGIGPWEDDARALRAWLLRWN